MSTKASVAVVLVDDLMRRRRRRRRIPRRLRSTRRSYATDLRLGPTWSSTGDGWRPEPEPGAGAGREGAQIGRCIRMASIATPSGMVKMHSSKS